MTFLIEKGLVKAEFAMLSKEVRFLYRFPRVAKGPLPSENSYDVFGSKRTPIRFGSRWLGLSKAGGRGSKLNH